jgi:hypothetical protein
MKKALFLAAALGSVLPMTANAIMPPPPIPAERVIAARAATCLGYDQSVSDAIFKDFGSVPEAFTANLREKKAVMMDRFGNCGHSWWIKAGDYNVLGTALVNVSTKDGYKQPVIFMETAHTRRTTANGLLNETWVFVASAPESK